MRAFLPLNISAVGSVYTFRLMKLLTILLTIQAEEFLLNLFSILRFEADQNVAKLRKPINKDNDIVGNTL